MLFARRKVLHAGASIVSIGAAGCIGTDDPTNERVYHEGERLVTVTVEEGFSTEVVIEADCRDEDVTVASGESARLEREEDGEECAIRLLAASEELDSVMIHEYAAYELTVKENGDVDALGAER